jgi:hypothetical protein
VPRSYLDFQDDPSVLEELRVRVRVRFRVKVG